MVSNGATIPLREGDERPGSRRSSWLVGCALGLTGDARVNRRKHPEALSMDAGDVDADAYEGLLDVVHECCGPAT